MTRSPALLLRLVGAALAAFALASCVTLLPKAKAVDLYRFGQAATSEAKTLAADRVGVFRASGSFQHESAGDRLMTSTNGQVAYVAETRWAAPATILWDQAVLGAFDANNGPARLISRGEPGTADSILRLDVRLFETHYDQGPKAPPTVVIRVRAALTGGKSRGLVSERVFETEVRASENRVPAIINAYDRAVGSLLKDVVDWTNTNAAAG